ncbi:hypothetical protein K469DRAFT_619222 [Zopfia rhizophila CBS 207.26]|uniref:Flap structure-specific endonuclease n=1 Tax=Zopfia rhizophila CBS 207.26 TaxID=1314779 RepID=A0A6A6ES28_9PEZI|nr:hypothetical protein K469DRAFT_619222 [Zopfia rhizophila CBS 207.26]
MGIHGIYKEIGPGQRIALSKLAVEKFEETGRPLRIAIDVSIWLFQIRASKGGSNPALRTFYYRLLRLISLSIHPIFVFDGPNKPPFKRNKRTGPDVASIPEFLAKQLLKQFGFPIHLAPGEAEAECALLQREGIVDAVLSEDVDTLMFGSGLTIRNWSPEQKTSKTPTHVNVYDAVKTKNGPSGLDREGMILIALMSGGDYVPEGIPGCGPKTACEAARAGFGKDLCKIAKNDTKAMQEWRERLQHELKTNESKLFKRKHGALVIPEDFPRTDILGYYTHPTISTQAGLDNLKRSIKWDQDLDFPGLRVFTYDAFDWVKLGGAKHFIRNLAPAMLVRHLRMRGEGSGSASDDPNVTQEEEAKLVKGIHGKRQHAVTDNTTEFRVSFTPIELVKIDLENEDQDDALPESDSDDEAPLEIDNGEAENAPKKRGPTQFDPTKPERVWVLETFVRVGVPLKVQDWEAGLLKPKKPTAAKDSNKAKPKAKGTKRVNTTGSIQNGSLDCYAKVTKPGVKRLQALGKAQSRDTTPAAQSQSAILPLPLRGLPTASQPSTRHIQQTVIDLLSSSPARAPAIAAPQPSKEKSVSPVLKEITSNATKRRRRGPLQRSHTLPADNNTSLDRPCTPPLIATIETLDLVSSPSLPPPSPLPSKKAKTRSTRMPPCQRTGRQASVVSSLGWNRHRQTTLETRSCSSASPTNSRTTTPPAITEPELFRTELETLDLTLSPPSKSPSPPSPPVSTFTASSSSFTFIQPPSSLSPPPKSPTSLPTFPSSTQSSPQILRRSPRNHTHSLQLSLSYAAQKPASPPALWKTQQRKKREIVLRKSLVGSWDYVDVSSPNGAAGSGVLLKGKERKRWRESEIEVLDLVD